MGRAVRLDCGQCSFFASASSDNFDDGLRCAHGLVHTPEQCVSMSVAEHFNATHRKPRPPTTKEIAPTEYARTHDVIPMEQHIAIVKDLKLRIEGLEHDLDGLAKRTQKPVEPAKDLPPPLDDADLLAAEE
jgi:hypothetical protein